MKLANSLRKELTEKQAAFLDALLEHRGSVPAACDACEISQVYGYTLVKTLREEIIERAEEVLALQATRAAFRLQDGMENELGMGANNVIEAAKQILDRVGIVKKDKLEISGPTGGIFLFPEKRD